MNRIIQFIQYLKRLFRKEEIGNGTGLTEDPVDYRDIILEAIPKKDIPVPENYSIPYILPKHNQGRDPICVGESVAAIKSEKERRERNDIAFDPYWIYNEAKKIDGIPNFQGTYFRSGLKVLKNTGAMPLGGGDPSMYRIGGYAKVIPTFNSIKEAIYRYGVVMVGYPRMSNKGWATENIRKLYKGERTFGHGVACVSYTKYKIKFQNSWGVRWGDKWYGYFTKDYLPSLAWVVLVDLPNNWKELLGSDKIKPKYTFTNNLQMGLRNDEVKMLQECLKYLGCFPNMDTTTFFGPITREAVRTFQKRYNISPPYGFVGPLTRTQLNKLFS